MSDKTNPQNNRTQSATYLIRIKGHLDSQWAAWFGAAAITLQEDGDTLITCRDLDQAALHGLLTRIRDLGLPLVSVNPAGPETGTQSDSHSSS